MFGNERGGDSELERLLNTGRDKQQHERDQAALERLELDETVRTPDGWNGFVAEKYPGRGRVYVESWEKGGTYRASRVEPVDR